MSKKYAVLSFSGKLASALALFYASLQPASANIQAANGATQVTKVKSTEVVNIATPSAAGLSHNKYNTFNVEQGGAVFNNAVAGGNSQLLQQQLAKNPNLKTESARVILNEVVSRNPSTLSGKQEIVGQKADYVLANPNGIDCNGCGFINTSRASLVVGTPNVTEGKLTGYDVTGDKALTTKGSIRNQNNHLDLIAPRINIEGAITEVSDLNIVTGRNRLARSENGKLTIQVTEAKGQVLDGKIAGSIQAGRIRIHSADDRATLSIQGANLNAKNAMTFTAGNVKADGKITRQKSSSNTQNTDKKRVKTESSAQKFQDSYVATSLKAETLVANVKNTLTLNGANVEAKNAVLSAGEIKLGAEKTTDYSFNRTSKSKGKWHRIEQSESEQNRLHRTTVTSDTLKLQSTRGKITSTAAKLTTDTLILQSKEDISLSGAITANTQKVSADFRNESPKLKTGQSSKKTIAETYTPTELQVKDTLLLGSNNNIHLTGVKAQIDGDFILQTKGKVNLNSEMSRNIHSVDDKQKFWGGLAGSKGMDNAKYAQHQHGADFTIAGMSYIEADKGVNIIGSRLLSAKNGYINSKSDVNIDSSKNLLITTENNHKGVIFNITKARNSSHQHAFTSQGSHLKSETNLQLFSDKSINVQGSQIISAGLLALNGKENVIIKGAENHKQSYTHNAGFNTALKLEKLDLKKKEAEASLTFDIYNKREKTNEVAHQNAQLVGKDILVNSKNIVVAGSELTAKDNLMLKADQISTIAQTDSVHSHKVDTGAKLQFIVNGKAENSITGTINANIKHNTSDELKTTAKTSQLNAGNTLSINAENIVHQGSKLSADKIVETAKQITHQVAANTQQSHEKNINVGLSLTSSIDTKKVLSGSASLNIDGERTKASSTTVKGTELKGNDISIQANQLQDSSTSYQANNRIDILANDYKFNSTHNTERKEAVGGGVNVGFDASSQDLNTVNLNLNVGAKYQQDQSDKQTAQKGHIQGNHINIQSDKLYSQADIQAQGNLTIKATENLTLANSVNSSSHKGGGFEAKVGVGALVIPAAQSAIPSVEVSAKINAHKGQSQQAELTTVQGNNVAIQSNGTTTLTGTNTLAKQQLSITGDTVNISAGQNNVKDVNVKLGLGVKVGANVSDLGLNGNIGVNHENSQTHNIANLEGNKTILAANKTLAMNGVNSQSNTLHLTATDLSLNAAPNKVNKTGFEADLSLNGGVKDKIWTPASGSGKLNVDVTRNETHSATTLNTQNAHLQVAGNAQFNGSTINAETATGKIEGNVTHQSLTDKINEVSVNLSANGSGKFTPYPQDKWQESAKKDWDNGTIAGVKAEVSVKAQSKKVRQPVRAGILVPNSNGLVRKPITQNAPIVPTYKEVFVNGRVNTNVQEMLKRGRADIQAKRTPLVQVSRRTRP